MDDEASDRSREEHVPEPADGLGSVGRVDRVKLIDGGALLFDADGFCVHPPGRSKRSSPHPYEEIRHIYVTDRVLLIGLDDDLIAIRKTDFKESERDAEFTRGELVARIRALPEGDELLAGIDKVDALGEREDPAWVVWATVALCVIGTGFQLANPMLEQMGAFLPDLFARGEYWRAFTSQFLHALTVLPDGMRAVFPMIPVVPIHLIVNVGGFAVLGYMVERPLGSWRMLMVMAMGALGSIGGILVYDHFYVIGASGMVSGLAGAMLAMELHSGGALPVFWRLPRRLLIAALVIQFAVIDQLMSASVAGGAHLGGFVGGYLAAWLMGAPTLEGLRPTQAIRFGTYCAGVLVAVGLYGIVPLANHDMAALERHALRLYDVPDGQYLVRQDNAAAWLIATGEGASSEGLELAVALADRAVRHTGGLFPGVLDTFAEALFRRGDSASAVLVIDQAIGLAPFEPYYVEQRKRYTGERDPGDRPPPPGAMPQGVLPPEVDDEIFGGESGIGADRSH